MSKAVERTFPVVVVLALWLAFPVPAEAVLPAAVQARLEAAAQEVRDLARQERTLSQTLNHRDLAESDSGLSHRRSEAAFSAAVIGAIADNPALVSEIVATAVAAAPEFRESIVANASAAFPGFAGAVRSAATGSGALPVSSYASAPPQLQPRPQPQPIEQARAPAPVPPLSMPSGTAESRGDPLAKDEEGDVYDPWEGFNRAIFAFNDVVDRYLLKPIAQGYGFLMPDVAKDNMRNAFHNLGEPVRLANDLLQFEGGDALVTTGRFLVNTTAGILGLFEVAEGWGMPAHPSDFGQTLHSYGSGPGPYLVLPILGPSTVRDGTGTVADIFFDPRTWFLDFYVNLGITGGKGVVRREELILALDDLRENSIDYYAALRSAYFQDRAVDLRRGKAPDSSELDKMFDSMP